MKIQNRTSMVLATICVVSLSSGARAQTSDEVAARWWKGNTHTHTLWSDGNAAPELVTSWYRERDYNFLVLSDHNILSQGEKWMAIADGGRLSPDLVEQLQTKFGEEQVEIREADDGTGDTSMRLRTLPELRARFESPGEFLLIQGEEVTTSFRRQQVHINAMNIGTLVKPQDGDDVRDVMQRNLDAIMAQASDQRSVLAHLNHPNFQWSLTPEDVAAIRGERFFEVFNGHPSVNNDGGEGRPGMDRLWDIALTLRLTELDLGILYGIACDDAHHYFSMKLGKSNPGRGWVMVRSPNLSANAIVDAMNRGDFYSSSGVMLRDVSWDGTEYRVEIDAEPGVTYTTEFIGTRDHIDIDAAIGYPGVGEVLFKTNENPASYVVYGDELYVRARVTSSRMHPNPYREGDVERAWMQPVLPRP